MLKTASYLMGRGTKTTRSLGAPQSLNPALLRQMSHQEHFFPECMPAVFTSSKSTVIQAAEISLRLKRQVTDIVNITFVTMKPIHKKCMLSW